MYFSLSVPCSTRLLCRGVKLTLRLCNLAWTAASRRVSCLEDLFLVLPCASARRCARCSSTPTCLCSFRHVTPSLQVTPHKSWCPHTETQFWSKLRFCGTFCIQKDGAEWTLQNTARAIIHKNNSHTDRLLIFVTGCAAHRAGLMVLGDTGLFGNVCDCVLLLSSSQTPPASPFLVLRKQRKLRITYSRASFQAKSFG